MAFMLQIQNYMSGIARLLNNSTFKAPLKTFFCYILSLALLMYKKIIETIFEILNLSVLIIKYKFYHFFR